MIKKLLTGTIAILALTVNAQSFSAKYNFAAMPSSLGPTTDPTPVPTVTGITFSSFMAVGTSTSAAGAGRFSFGGWPTGATSTVDTYSTMTGAIDLAKYYNVTITPSAGYYVTLNNVTFTTQRSNSGIRSYAVRTSADSYTTNLPASVGTSTVLSINGTNQFFFNFDATTSAQAANQITFSDPAFTNFNTALTVRFYGWNAEGTTGTFSIDSVIFNGSVGLATGLGSVNFDLNSNFNVYPVPSNDGVLFIENKNATEVSKIEIMDILGNVIQSNASTNESRIKLNLANVPSGNYFVRITSGKSSTVKKIVVFK